MILWALMSAALGSPDCVALDRGAPPLQGQAGQRRLALIVGVGDYKAKPGGQSIDLKGPPNDALRIRDTLVEQYGFPASNVCMLRDRDATRANYLEAWQAHLGRAASGDTVVYYFAGHGSQTTDFDGPGDETDGLDETILLYDSRVGDTGDLIDDEFNGLLAQLYRKTENITVLVDACNSGTSTRGVPHEAPAADDAVERRVAPIARIAPAPGGLGAGTGDYRPERLAGIVVVTAAQDGTSALERNGQGIFTNALLKSLEGRGNGSWEQLMLTIPRWIAAERSFQVPTFEGRLDRRVFGSTVVQRDLSWQVLDVTDSGVVSFRGPAMPGWTPGAVVRVFEDGNTRYKARVRLSQVGPMQARGSFIGMRQKPVAPGDFAVLESPATEAVSIRVQIADNVPLARDIRKALQSDKVLARTVQIVDTAADFYLRPGPDNAVDIWGAEGARRNRMNARNDEDANNIAYNLGLHARQLGLVELTGEPNDVYPDDMFAVRVTPVPETGSCARTPYTPSPVPVPYVEVPMCSAVQLEVTLTRTPRRDLYLGILYLASNGTIEVWPRAGTVEVLRREGDTYTEPLGWVSPPLQAHDRIVVFGTHEPVAWSKLQAQALRDVKTRGAGFQQFIDAHVGGTRGIDDEAPSGAGDTAFTASYLQLEVVADEAKWTQADRENPEVCRALREAGCR